MKLARWIIPPLTLFLASVATSVEAARLTYWNFDLKDARLDLITDAGVKPRALVVPNPTRVIIDLPNTSIRRPKNQQKIKSRYIKEMRVAQFNKSTTRIVLELSKQYTISPSKLEIRGIAPNRWFVRLPKFFPVRDANPQSQKLISVQVPPAKLPDPRASAPSVPVRPGAKVVAIDPGHGGRDPGAVGNGLYEKNVVFSISQDVIAELRRRGINAIATRSSDVEVDLQPRVDKAEGIRADVFVSIHANAISLSRPDINGLETYYYATASGYRLARNIHNSILQNVSIGDRGIRQARFYVLRKTSMPAVLVETGFITGARDSANFKSAAYRQKMAKAIAEGIINYLNGR
ncbi:N-acetylmuramoyl-L-alanine amidase [Lyngbya confervoides]|uniref:N-acetylmuramoyl-L-alanine amidase n=1 Tax=Lyngbya confervoides BDU141951 TaxID=1574623 RepID=A0ABD4T7X9_9CYAN|nr:N-acetylmuramoyl-L-alanine amidase [Lyngbya confervoides]MCM1984578.1 N-acetylmuramoyl-L-alanine amidase [Lyngbya confervoides BDU141951]